LYSVGLRFTDTLIILRAYVLILKSPKTIIKVAVTAAKQKKVLGRNTDRVKTKQEHWQCCSEGGKGSRIGGEQMERGGELRYSNLYK